MNFLIANSGWIGIILCQLVPWFQIYKIYKSKKSKDVSVATYVCLMAAVSFYLIHALDIKDLVFIIAQSLTLFSNAVALMLILKFK